MSAPCPEIVVYKLASSTHPEGPMMEIPSYVARFYQNREFLPMLFSARESETAIAAARQFWTDEATKIDDTKAKRGAALVKARAARVSKRKGVDA